MNNLNIVILAAGKGTRMYSDTPKVLHPLAGKPLLKHIIATSRQLLAKEIHVVYGYAGDKLQAALADENITLIHQAEQLGTGHAVLQTSPYIKDDENVLILYGDVPLISPKTLQRLLDHKPQNGLALLTAHLDNPTGYGRIVRENGQVCKIVEEKDATDAQKAITEINTGILVASGASLKQWLSQLTNNNAQKEYYLTDIIDMAYQSGQSIEAVHPDHLYEIEGINNRLQLAQLERVHQHNQVTRLMLAGVTFYDPARFDLRGELQHGKDVTIDCNVIIEGNVILGDRVHIGAGTILKDCQIDNDTVISPYSVIEGSQLGQSCSIGPFARLRPGTRLADHVHIGNFVEAKNAALGHGTKAGHLSYLGDADIGRNVNIGAGTITCNYDGANKFKTQIGDDVFVGSDTQLVAPVSIANGVTIGAGTTVTSDVPENTLVISRVRQKHIEGWQRPKKIKK